MGDEAKLKIRVSQLEADLAALSARMQEREDIEEIKKVTARYCVAADKGDIDPPDYVERIADCFTEDGVWDGGAISRAEGMEGFQRLWGKSRENGSTFVIHRAANPIIEVNGDKATGHWHMLALVIFKDQALWTAGQYDNQYVRTTRGWKISVMNYTPWLWSRHNEGWAKERFFEIDPDQTDTTLF